MISYSGRNIWPAWMAETRSPEGVPTDIGPSLDDIAVGLGRQSRFAGQTRDFYTVLCHSLVCGKVAREFFPEDTMLRRWLLLHDGHESVLSDVPTTWKNSATRVDEADIDRRIAAEHGLEELDELEKAQLKWIDACALAGEAHALGHAEAEKWWPRAKWDGIAERCYALTKTMVLGGLPYCYLEPDNAICALERALES